ncbi:FAD-dependent oxidoreductase [Micromonospora sp. WMMD734]|uniref:FAD-dependent oxidoreductase n=1 Tax=Micromonospora humidisoli TaxID=2807622 RepID=A0ABS2JIY7_9ACTN|nr:FAD-dependent oxidoreductase [Micromonospora humidisoli]MBM7086349.1 FAD-dependent oxidoreductase [Micromonospora humidisoli]
MVKSSSLRPPVTRTFAMTDVVRQYRELVEEDAADPARVHDTLIVGGGAAGAGVLRDLASRGDVSALLVDRGPFGGETSSKTGKAIHPGIRYLRMAFHRMLLAAHLRRDPKIRQSSLQHLRSAWLDLQLVWYGTRERKILLETTGGTVEEIPNIVFVLPDSPEKKWSVFFGISLYDLFTTLWAWCGLVPRFSRVKVFRDRAALHRELPHLAASDVVGGIRYWDGKANNDKILVVKTIRDAYLRGGPEHPIRALCHVEVDGYEWDPAGYFRVTLARRFADDSLPETVVVRARTITNAAGPWIDEARHRTAEPDGRRSVAYSRGTHLEATNRFIHETIAADPRLQVGLVPLNAERQHYLRPFHQHGLWYVQCTTTDRGQQDPYRTVPEADEYEELLHSYNDLVDDRWKIDRRDIFNVFCGIRPLASTDGGEISVKDISRMFRIHRRVVGDGLLLDLVNVKLTDIRWAGQVVSGILARELRDRHGRRIGRSTTKRLPFLPVVDEQRYAPDHPATRGDREFIRAKAAHHVTYQMVGSYSDYLLNTGAVRDAVVFDADGRADLDLSVLDLVLAELAERLGWDEARRRAEWTAFQEIYTRNMAYADLGARVRDHEPVKVDRLMAGGVD